MTPELVRRIVVTIGALLLFRLGTYIPLPGINPAIWERFFGTQQGGILGMFNLFASDGIHRMAILALGLIPYLSAAVIMKLLSVVWRGLKSLERSGEDGRRRIARYTLILTLFIAAFYGYRQAVGLQAVNTVVANPGSWFVLSATASMVGGTFFLVWLSEQITRHGIGNGLALIFLTGIVAELPSTLVSLFEMGRVSSPALPFVVSVMVVAMIAFVVFMEGARRNIRVEFAGRMAGKRMLPARSTVLPIKINSAGFLMPATMSNWIIFGPLDFPAVRFDGGPGWSVALANHHWWSAALVNHHLIIGAIAVFVIAFIYTAHVIDPEHTAESLRKHGGVISGVEPGESTAKHLDRVVSLTTVVGATYLVILWLFPELLLAFGVSFFFSGGAALIVVCTVLDIRTQVRDLSRINLMGAEQR